MNFSYKQINMYFANISTATVSPKCKMVGTTKQTPKSSWIIAEMNPHIEHMFTVLNAFFQLANREKIFVLLVLLKTMHKLH